MCFRLMNRFWHSRMPSSELNPPARVGGHGLHAIGRGRCGVGESVGWGLVGGSRAICCRRKRTIGPTRGERASAVA